MYVEIKNDLAFSVPIWDQQYNAQRPFSNLEVARVISIAFPYQNFKAI